MAFLIVAMLSGCRVPRSRDCVPCCAPSHSVGERRDHSTSLGDAEPLDESPQPKPEKETSSLALLTDEDDEESAEGLTLQAAIDRLLSANYDLAAKFQDIPKAQADILSARLRNDPVVFLSATQLPYQQYSSQRPGTPLYDITFVQALDVSGKHRTSVRVAQQEHQVMLARYQNAVRRAIEKLYNMYVDVLEARALVKTTKAEVTLLTELVESARRLVQQGMRPRAELTEASLRKARSEIALQRAETALRRARRNLAVMLALPEQADSLKLRSSLHDRAPPPPSTDELIRIALESRPDLVSYRLSVQRAQAQVRQERAAAIEDVFLFFSPYQAIDFSAQNKQTANGWEIGVMLPFPALNRNQGNVARARANVSQFATEAASAEQQVVSEIRRAVMEYEVSRNEVERYEGDLLPGVQSVREDKYRLYLSGQRAIDAVLTAQRDYNEVVRDYLQALVRHRRSMLELNSAVGQRILP